VFWAAAATDKNSAAVNNNDLTRLYLNIVQFDFANFGLLGDRYVNRILTNCILDVTPMLSPALVVDKQKMSIFANKLIV
jgi:hypothetical protein